MQINFAFFLLHRLCSVVFYEILVLGVNYMFWFVLNLLLIIDFQWMVNNFLVGLVMQSHSIYLAMLRNHFVLEAYGII